MLVHLSSCTRTHKDACCTVCMSELRVPLRLADRSEWLCSLLCSVPMKTVFSQLFIGGGWPKRRGFLHVYVSLLSFLWRSRPWHPDSEQLVLISLMQNVFKWSYLCVPCLWNELFVYISSICIYVCEPCALLSVEASFQTVCIHCSIITLVKTLLSLMFSIFPVSPVKVWLHAIVGHVKVMPLMLTSDMRIMTKVPLPAYS